MRNWEKGGESQVEYHVWVYGLEYARNMLGLGQRKGYADLGMAAPSCDSQH